jgi:hypothetical protein
VPFLPTVRHHPLQSILHSDLKARNILLKSSPAEARGFVAKVRRRPLVAPFLGRRVLSRPAAGVFASTSQEEFAQSGLPSLPIPVLFRVVPISATPST